MEQKPSIGRIVHYTNLGDKDGKYPPEVQAAVITGVYSQQGSEITPANKVGDIANTNLVDLRVLYRTGEFNMTRVLYSESPERGHWNWPPRV